MNVNVIDSLQWLGLALLGALFAHALLSRGVKRLLWAWSPLATEGTETLTYQRRVYSTADRRSWLVVGVAACAGLAWGAGLAWPSPASPGLMLVGALGVLAALAFDLQRWERVAVSADSVWYQRGLGQVVHRVLISSIRDVQVHEFREPGFSLRHGFRNRSARVSLILSDEYLSLPKADAWTDGNAVDDMATFLLLQLPKSRQALESSAQEVPATVAALIPTLVQAVVPSAPAAPQNAVSTAVPTAVPTAATTAATKAAPTAAPTAAPLAAPTAAAKVAPASRELEVSGSMLPTAQASKSTQASTQASTPSAPLTPPAPGGHPPKLPPRQDPPKPAVNGTAAALGPPPTHQSSIKSPPPAPSAPSAPAKATKIVEPAATAKAFQTVKLVQAAQENEGFIRPDGRPSLAAVPNPTWWPQLDQLEPEPKPKPKQDPPPDEEALRQALQRLRDQAKLAIGQPPRAR